jgi:hypothetical protein
VGLDIRTAEFLLKAKQLGADYSRVATLGHQRVMLSQSERRRLEQWLGDDGKCEHEYADPFLKALGANELNAIDASHYEGAEIIHNLNADLPPDLHQRFTCLIDGGTLEHVFDIRQSLKGCMQMVKVGGHLIICQMANNCMGHGFYQFSPEFFYCTLTPENGYRVKFMALCEDGRWYEPLPPAKAGERIQARTSHETFIYVLAERITDVPPFMESPHQTDYVSNLGMGVNAASGAARPAPAASAFKALRKRAGDLKRRYVYGALPWLRRIEERFVRQRNLRHDRLSNARRFRAIGKRLFTALLGYFAFPLEFGFEVGSGAGSVLF